LPGDVVRCYFAAGDIDIMRVNFIDDNGKIDWQACGNSIKSFLIVKIPMKKLMFVFLLSSSVAVVQGLTPEEREMIGDAIVAGDTNVFLQLADKCPPEDNQYWDLQFFKAVMLYELGQYPQAIELFSIVKDAAPVYAIRSYQGISVAKEKSGDKAGADFALKASKELADEGTRMMLEGDDKGAIKYYSDYLAANPKCTNTIVYASLAILLEARDQKKKPWQPAKNGSKRCRSVPPPSVNVAMLNGSWEIKPERRLISTRSNALVEGWM